MENPLIAIANDNLIAAKEKSKKYYDENISRQNFYNLDKDFISRNVELVNKWILFLKMNKNLLTRQRNHYH